VPHVLDTEKDQLIRQALKDGKTYAEIRDSFKVAPQTISRIKRDMEYTKPAADVPIMTLCDAQSELNRIASSRPATMLSLQALKEYIACLKNKTFEDPNDVPTLDQKIDMMKKLLTRIEIIEIVKAMPPSDLDTIAAVLSDIARERKTKPDHTTRPAQYDGAKLNMQVQQSSTEIAHHSV